MALGKPPRACRRCSGRALELAAETGDSAYLERQAGFLLLSGQLHVGRQADSLEAADDVPRQVKLPPLHAVPRGAGHSVMVIVPADATAVSDTGMVAEPNYCIPIDGGFWLREHAV